MFRMDRQMGVFNYESVEYSDGYYHTVFNPEGEKFAECSSEAIAKEMCEGLNKKRCLHYNMTLSGVCNDCQYRNEG